MYQDKNSNITIDKLYTIVLIGYNYCSIYNDKDLICSFALLPSKYYHGYYFYNFFISLQHLRKKKLENIML